MALERCARHAPSTTIDRGHEIEIVITPRYASRLLTFADARHVPELKCSHLHMHARGSFFKTFLARPSCIARGHQLLQEQHAGDDIPVRDGALRRSFNTVVINFFKTAMQPSRPPYLRQTLDVSPPPSSSSSRRPYEHRGHQLLQRRPCNRRARRTRQPATDLRRFTTAVIELFKKAIRPMTDTVVINFFKKAIPEGKGWRQCTLSTRYTPSIRATDAPLAHKGSLACVGTCQRTEHRS
ncbi:hypothetical protein AURDEDRAFT_174357 [Auricularia subglabra TFB-10046 SS5]|nr:hypothetical protein AURDEDRAFT_174357 [Auricularia subglabra TFB-10046 SS5]